MKRKIIGAAVKKRCKRIGPLTGLRCILPAGHKGQHKNDLKAARRLAKEFMDAMFPARRGRKSA